ncbi:MAG: vitamin K epoxide reductase family protein [Archangium sp.]|nr:vitamin K epoxide reductase family protein [Archangium sp.]
MQPPDESQPLDLEPAYGAHATRGPLIVAVLGALLGSVFAAVSTSDFMQHLDRQVHSVHCSFIPGAGKELGESGCKAVLMSPYSSFFRESVWGGVPVSLWALATFAFLVYRASLLLWRGKPSRAETTFLLAATALPVLMSLVYGYLSVAKVGETCKVCMGIYVSSALVFVGALLAHLKNPARPDDTPQTGKFALWFGEGVAFVAVLSITYLVVTPTPDKKTSLAGCGSLVSGEDPNEVMLPLPSGDGEPAIEVLDPLCPACKAFDERLGASSLRKRLKLKAVLFPLDPSCNWMVTEALHPGACAVSEAMLCAGGVVSGRRDEKAAQEVLRWSFKNQEKLRELAGKDEKALRTKIEQTFPGVKGCLGSAGVKSKLTKSLRWAVANAIPVLTPQLFVGNSRMCDEDSDLGLEFTLTQMLSKQGKAARALIKPPPKPAPVISAPTPAPAPKTVVARPPPSEPEPAAEPETTEAPETQP